ncbi:MAG: response regulator [Burkholderiales bacterium]|nr:response regulator [Burkholderiales bacterium]
MNTSDETPVGPHQGSAPRVYTTIDVARRLGVSLQTVQRWVDAGHLKAWKTPGGHRRIDAASAERLFRQQDERLGALAATEPARGAGAGTVAAPLVVVVVDDEPLDRALMVDLVQEALPNARVEAASDGFQGLVVIGQLAPAIVITDIHMPHIDGFEMLRSLLEGPGLRPRRLIAVSAYAPDDLAALGTLPEGVLLFGKPLNPQRFIAALRALV